VTTTILFVRHVPHEHQDKVHVSRTDGVRLAADAPERLARLARRLRHETLAAVYASPVSRAIETAAAATERPASDVRVRDEFTEIEFGEWTGLTVDEVDRDPRHKVWNTVRSLARPPSGETMLEVQARMVLGVEALRRDHPDETVAVFSHGDPIKCAILYLLGMPIDFYDRIDVDPGSITTAFVGDWGAKIHRLNEAA
jgi:broad specificity phosphatase PhoE